MRAVGWGCYTHTMNTNTKVILGSEVRVGMVLRAGFHTHTVAEIRDIPGGAYRAVIDPNGNEVQWLLDSQPVTQVL